MTSRPAVADPAEAMRQVRTAYRLIHAYHRRLLDVVTMARDAVAAQHAELRRAWWHSWAIKEVPSYETDPTPCWAQRFVPLEFASLRWASDVAPSEGGFCIGFDHSADGALATACASSPNGPEPDTTALEPVGTSTTTLEAWVLATTAGPHKKWETLLERLDATPAVTEEAWTRGAISVHAIDGATVALGGFSVSVATLWTRADVEEHLAAPLVKLVGEARAALPKKPARRKPKA